MHRNYTFPLCLFVFCIFFACEEPIDFEIDQQSRLVVTSHFSVNKDLVVYVSETEAITSNVRGKFVENATITVFSDNDLIEVLDFVPNENLPYYRSQLLNPVPGVVYTIKVEVLGFKSITATNSIPVPVPIQEVNFANTFDEDQNNFSVVNFNVTVTLQDPAEYQNFYHMVFYQELIPFTMVGTDTVKSPEIFNGTPISISLLDLNLPAESYYDDRSFLLTDEQFNGQMVVLPFRGSYTFDPSSFLTGNFIVELRTVSRAYYDYHSSLNYQINNGENPFSDDHVIIDNIDNGEGIFAGYSTMFSLSKLSN